MALASKRRLHTILLTAVGAALFAGLTPTATAAAGSERLENAREATAAFRNIDAATDAGYARFTDVAGIACIDNPGVGAMGIHYVNGALVGNPAIQATKPEALVYQPLSDGRLRLVALEYIVVQAAWQGAGHTAAPSLFGHQFELIPSPNRYGLPPFYELHAWVWKHNPLGMFNDWNSSVSCHVHDQQ
jgi:hypothetical protein